MVIIIIMMCGAVIGNRLFPQKGKKFIDILATACTLILIFTMGLSLGRRPDFLSELSELGWKSFIYFFFPTIFSLIAVFILTKKYLSNRKRRDDR